MNISIKKNKSMGIYKSKKIKKTKEELISEEDEKLISLYENAIIAKKSGNRKESSKIDAMIKDALKEKLYFYDDEWEIFINCAYCRNSQSWGNIVPNYFYENFKEKLKKLGNDDVLGDMFSIIKGQKKGSELKNSHISNNKYNIVQIREFHSMNYFLFGFHDIYNKSQFIFISSEDFFNNFHFNQPAHGSKETNKVNINIEKRKTLSKSDIEKLKQYNILPGTDYEDLVKFINNEFEIIKD